MNFNLPLFFVGLGLLLVVIIYTRRYQKAAGRRLPPTGVNYLSFIAYAIIAASIVRIPFTGNIFVDIMLTITGFALTGISIDVILRKAGISQKIYESKSR